MTDTHCHLTFPQYDGDPTSPSGLPTSPSRLRPASAISHRHLSTPNSRSRGGSGRQEATAGGQGFAGQAGLRGASRETVLARARAAGVTWVVNPGTDLAQSRAAVALAEVQAGEEPTVFAAVGVHPHDVGSLTDESFAELSELARHPRVVAIGEVGLERSARSPELDVQRRWLERFVTLAREVGKPLIFHVRGAHVEFRRFLERSGPTRNDPATTSQILAGAVGPAPRSSAIAERSGVVHCFSGALEDAQFYTARGLFLGVTGIVTFPNAEALRDVVRAVSLEHLLLETDAPFLAPQSHRGQRNEPAYLREITEGIAAVKEVSPEEVIRVTDASARTLFALYGEQGRTMHA